MVSAVKRTWKLQEFTAHTANVNCLAMGHKSHQVLATGGDDKKVNLWAIGRPGCLMSLSGHSTSVECVCFGHSEDMVCAGSQSGGLKIWDLEAAKLLRALTGHKGAIKCMDFHPYGGYLTTGSCDTQMKLWDTRQKGCITTYSSHKMAVNSLQFSPDGQWLASGGDEGVVKVWDVRNGRVLKEFVHHTGAVSCVKFHPHEFLLASCGDDYVVNFWDMEKFQLVSSTEKQKTPVRLLAFSDDGSCLLGGGGEGLQVLGWEPTRHFDVVPASWGQIYDMTVAHNKLFVGWFHSSNVVLNVVELSKVHPFGGPPPPGPPVEPVSPFQKNSSVRKSFSKERPTKQVVHRKSLLDQTTVEESASGTEEEEQPAVIPNFTDYSEIFRPSRALNRTPPPLEESPPPLADPMSSLSSEVRGLSLNSLDPPSPTYHSAPNSLNDDASGHYSHRSYESVHTATEDSDIEARPIKDNQIKYSVDRPLLRQHSDGDSKVGNTKSYNSGQTSVNNRNYPGIGPRNLKPSTSEMSLKMPPPPPRSQSFTRPSRNNYDQQPASQSASARDYPSRNIRSSKNNTKIEIYVSQPQPSAPPEERTPSPDFIPIATDRPVGLDLEEFLPKSHMGYTPAQRELSEQEVLSVMMRGHEPMMAVLATRQRSLQVFHSMWMGKNLKVALESTIAAGDLSVVLDILNVMVFKPSIWNLDICTILLPQIHSLLQSKYESYMMTGCTALRLILRNFASVISSNIRCGIGGVDISREERVNKCKKCRDHLLLIKNTLQTRRPHSQKVASLFSDLQTSIEQNIE